MSCCYKEDILRDHDDDDDNGETGMLALRLSIGMPTSSSNRPPPASAEAAAVAGVGCRPGAATSPPTVSSSSAAGASAQNHHRHQYFRYRPQPPEKKEMMVMTSSAAEVVDRVLMIGGDDRDDDGDGGGGGRRKKLRLSKEQSALLEDRFKEHTTLNPKHKQALAKQLNLRPRQVEVWFQNRRARTKLKQTEMDCEFLKKCCETLTEENRRLLRELHELKSAKQPAPAPAQQFMQQLPSAALAAARHTCDLPGGPTSSVASTRTRRE